MHQRDGHLAFFAALVMLAFGCAAPDRTAVIGLGYRGFPYDVARLAKEALDASAVAGNTRVDLLVDLPAGARPPAGQLAAEVDYAARLVAVPDLVAVVGHQGSRDALMAAPIYEEAKIPVVVPTATSRRLREVGSWTFTLAPNDSLEGEYLGALAARLGPAGALLFYVGDEYGIGLRDGVAAALARRGIPLLDAIPVTPANECAGSGEQANATQVDAALRRHQTGVVILATRQREGGCIMRHIHGQRPGTRFIAGDGVLISEEFLALAGRSADSLYAVGFWHHDRPDPASRAFAEAFRRLAGREANSSEAMVYDAVMVLAAAIRAAGPSRQRVRDYLASLGHGRPGYAGVTGTITFPASVERFVTLRVREGRLVLANP